MDWIELIKQVSPDAQFSQGASEEQLSKLKTALNSDIPLDLESLLKQTNGVHGKYGIRLLWSIDEIIEENTSKRARKDYMPLDSLLFFADAGNGEYFGYMILENESNDTKIYVWNPIDDNRVIVADSLEEFISAWLSGKLNI